MDFAPRVMTALASRTVWVAVAAGAAMAGWMYLQAVPKTSVAPTPPGLVAEVAPRVIAAAAPASGLESSTTSAPASAPIVVLRGVAMGVDGGNLALVSVDHRPEMLLRVGDLLGPSATVERIDGDSMTYRFAGIAQRVSVKPSVKVAAQEGPAPQPTHLPGFVAGAPAMARSGGLEPGSGNEAFRLAVEKKLQAIASGR